jgi:hypothetical protein
VSSQDTIVRYIDQQLGSIVTRPAMWGTDVAVELQAVMLLELRAVVLRSPGDDAAPRAVRDAFNSFVRKRLPDAPPVPLADILNQRNRGADLATFLADFIATLKAQTPETNPFSKYDVALVLELKADVPTASAGLVGEYIEGVRRAIRGILRRHSRGRPGKEYEAASDLLLPTIDVSPANGAPSRITVPMMQPALQTSSSHVSDALADIVATVEWASTKEPPRDLTSRLEAAVPLDRLAAQTLRLLPRRDIELVHLGGRIMDRSQPVTLLREHALRLNQAIAETQKRSHKVHDTGSVRELDLDKYSFRLTSGTRNRAKCVLASAELLPIVERALGRTARVTGREYQSDRTKFIMIESITPLDTGKLASPRRVER